MASAPNPSTFNTGKPPAGFHWVKGLPGYVAANVAKLRPKATAPAPAYSSYSFSQLKQLWISAGGQKSLADTMAAIALAESGGNPTIQNQQGYDVWGLWQINIGPGANTEYTQAAMVTPMANARAAVAILNSQGLTAWQTYTNGAYLAFLNGTRTSGGTVSTTSTPMLVRPGGASTTSDPMMDALTAYHQQTTVDTTSVMGFLFNPFTAVSDLVSGISDVGSFLKFLGWLINPANILRMVEFLVGLALMAFGIQAAVQGRGESREGYETGEAAISRSGLGRVSRELAAATVTHKRPAKPATAPHKVRRTALRVRYEREQKVADKRTAQRRSPKATSQGDS